MDNVELIEAARRSSVRRLMEPIHKSRNFTALWSGQTLSQFGDGVLWVVLPLCVYSINKSTLDMGWIMALLMIPQVILLPFAGVLVDRVSRSRLMITTETVRCLIVGTLAVLSALHHMSIPILSGFVIIYAIMDALFQPAYSAARAQIFTDDIRSAALSLTQVSQELGRLLGPAIGGVIAGFISIGAGFGFDAIMLCISVITLSFLRVPKPRYERHRSSQILRNFGRDLIGGFIELRKHSWLWITIVAFTVINIADTGITAILLPWLVKVHLHLPDTSYGLVNSAAGVGAIVAALLYGRKNNHRRRGFVGYGCIIVNALAFLFLTLGHSTFELMLLMAVANGAIMIFMLIWEGSLQELIPSESYGRVASLDLFGSWTLLPIGNVLSGWLATKIGGIETMLIEGTLMFCVAIGVMLIPAIRKFD
ncbi:MFS transporter [Alicyclobacillus fastidiosus]|uniref:MFS transporter n=1 Tax=Alicyclobacillus fastidiosus TaxID=392011 RepID=A0ABY6ZJJ4_9BACL|nr:MFS transporter [Alicyclobacillus fastidiosus]WAH43044.1 MFS transporter [Alicyclobacillus fastidiosus]GMA65024.1 MFS transporter [Alicyclobacillus fastidiosus]